MPAPGPPRRSLSSLQVAGGIALVLLAALLLRLRGIAWGLPEVYEEATPLRKAWELWGWGAGQGFHWNPHFFNYPSFTIYLQFLGQGLLFLGMKASGAVHSALDFRLLYIQDPTAFLVVGRLISVAFALGTVWITTRIGWKLAGWPAGLAAGLLLAGNGFHVTRSQMVEVDVPLAFWTALTLLLLMNAAERPGLRRLAGAGFALGLAVSTKYTAALLVVPLATAYASGCRRASLSVFDGRHLTWLAAALGAAAAAFCLTSPFVLLDASTFLAHLGVERSHMHLGQFGSTAGPTWLYYAEVLGRSLVGWPALVLAVVGSVFLAGERRPGFLILASFVLVYLGVLCTWAMRADRYLMPVLPLLLLLAAAGVVKGLERLRPVPAIRVPVRLAIVALLLWGQGSAYAEYLARARGDTRTEAKRWIETHVPGGSFVVTEQYGPELLGAPRFLSLESDLRERLDRPEVRKHLYPMLVIPMFQVNPEQADIFYDPALYAMSDVIVTSSLIRSRYARDPQRFPREAAFYDSLDHGFRKLAEFDPGTVAGPTLTLYGNPRNQVPFYRRGQASNPPVLPSGKTWTGREGAFYLDLGIDYEAARFPDQAILCYDRGLACRLPEGMFSALVLGKTRCLLMQRRRNDAVQFLRDVERQAPNPGERAYVGTLLQSVTGAAR